MRETQRGYSCCRPIKWCFVLLVAEKRITPERYAEEMCLDLDLPAERFAKVLLAPMPCTRTRCVHTYIHAHTQPIA